MISDEELAAIEARLAAATPGPWGIDPSPYAGGQAVCTDDAPVAETNDKADATLIAHAPADLRALVDTVRELRDAAHPDPTLGS